MTQLEWKITHNPEVDKDYGFYWSAAICSCGEVLRAYGSDRERLARDQERLERFHFAYIHSSYLQAKLRREIAKGERESCDCECCGRKNLKHPYVVDGHVVGSECKNHPERFPCRGEV
jgi:hypothetical protein